MTPLLGTLRATRTTRTPPRPPHGGLRRELHEGWGAELAKERETQERGEQRRVEDLPMMSSCLSHVLARPALLNCWDQ